MTLNKAMETSLRQFAATAEITPEQRRRLEDDADSLQPIKILSDLFYRDYCEDPTLTLHDWTAANFPKWLNNIKI